MRHLTVSLVLVFLCSVVAHSQEKPVVEVLPGGREIEIKLDSGKALPSRFVRHSSTDFSNYSLHELEPKDEPGMVSKDRSNLFDRQLKPECAGFDCPTIRLSFIAPLLVHQTYILVLNGFTDDGKAATARFEVKAPIADAAKATLLTGPNVYEQRKQLTLASTVPIEVKGPVEVHRRFYRLTPDYSALTEASDTILADVDQKNEKRFVLKLHRSLIQGQDLSLFIPKGITVKGSPERALQAEGKIKLSGMPTKPDDIKLDVNLSALAAVNQKPVFSLASKYVPTRISQVGNTEWIWEPTFSVDVGLRSTKSANSIVLAPLNFTNYFGESLSAFQIGKRRRPALNQPPPGESKIYARWMETPWYRPSDVKLTLGPKAEFDRNFRRKNLLGSLRMDFDFHRWRASIGEKRSILEKDYEDDKAKAVRIAYGWSTVPYVSFDVGGHVSNETITNTKKNVSAVVPRHGIFRSYFGLVTILESNQFLLPLTLTIDQAFMYLAQPETIGYVTDSGVGTRRLEGFHPRSKATVNFALDPAKHYSLSLIFESGRSAPNFEYLNKLTAGFRVVLW